MRVNEIFYSLQGEGRYTGVAAVFIRLAGCNLRCDFCDTDHEPYKDLTEEEIMQEIAKYPANHIVITGGEPTLQITRSFIDRLHEAGKYVQIETNGTIALKDDLDCCIDWITLSPKYAKVKIQRFDELKVVYQGQDMSQYDELQPACIGNRYLQPCDRKDKEKNAKNIAATVAFIEAHPEWRLSLQTQKIINVR